MPVPSVDTASLTAWLTPTRSRSSSRRSSCSSSTAGPGRRSTTCWSASCTRSRRSSRTIPPCRRDRPADRDDRGPARQAPALRRLGGRDHRHPRRVRPVVRAGRSRARARRADPRRPEHHPRLPDGPPHPHRGPVLQGRRRPAGHHRGHGRGGRAAADDRPRRPRHRPLDLERDDPGVVEPDPDLRDGDRRPRRHRRPGRRGGDRDLRRRRPGHRGGRGLRAELHDVPRYCGTIRLSSSGATLRLSGRVRPEARAEVEPRCAGGSRRHGGQGHRADPAGDATVRGRLLDRTRAR